MHTRPVHQLHCARCYQFSSSHTAHVRTAAPAAMRPYASMHVCRLPRACRLLAAACSCPAGRPRPGAVGRHTGPIDHRSIDRDIECMPAHALPTAASGCPYDTSRVVSSARSSRQLQPYVTSTCREQFS
jgi:hypothetical protein